MQSGSACQKSRFTPQQNSEKTFLNPKVFMVLELLSPHSHTRGAKQPHVWYIPNHLEALSVFPPVLALCAVQTVFHLHKKFEIPVFLRLQSMFPTHFESTAL